jgi:hypothetical protein
MAGCIANANNNQFIFGSGLLQGYIIPGLPKNRIGSMLAQVQTRLPG